MKKFILLLAIVMFAFMAKAASDMNCVVSNGKSYFSPNMKTGLTGIRMSTDEGLTLKIPYAKIDFYNADDKVYERLPLISRGGKERGTALLQLVGFHSGYRLYSYESCDHKLGRCFADESGFSRMYFVYKDGKLHLRVDEKNIDNVFSFFGLKAIVVTNELLGQN